jgi:hypothetical protein
VRPPTAPRPGGDLGIFVASVNGAAGGKIRRTLKRLRTAREAGRARASGAKL